MTNGAHRPGGGHEGHKGGAGFANSEMMLAGGKWDTFRMLTHPGTAIIPSGARRGGDAKAHRAAISSPGVAAGYEVMERMAADWIPTVMARGFHASPVFGIFGAAIAAAKIMRFTEDQMHGADLAVHQPGGQQPRAQPARLREGAAVRNAMLAVALAKQGTCRRRGRARRRRPASITPTPATTTASSPTASPATRTPASTSSPPGSARTGCFSRRCTASTRSPGYNIAHVDVTAKLCEEHDISLSGRRSHRGGRELAGDAVSRAPRSRRSARTATGEPRRGSTRYYSAYGVVKRGFPLLRRRRPIRRRCWSS